MADEFNPDAYLQSTVPMQPTGFDPDAFLGNKPQAPSQPEISTGQAIADVPLSAGIGLIKGGLGMAGLPGDLRELAAKGASKAAGAFGYEVDPATVSKGLKFLPLPGAAGPTSQQIREPIESVTGPLYEPKTGLGRYAEFGGELAPAVFGGPGSVATKLATRVGAPAVVGQTAAEIPGIKDTAAEPYVKALGALTGALTASGISSGIRAATQPEAKVSASLARALERDRDTPEEMVRRLEEVRQIRPNATLADVGGENVRDLVERIAQTPNAGRTQVVPALTQTQQGQMARLSNDLTGLTGTRQTAHAAVQDTMAARQRSASPLYERAYADGDVAVWSPELERLSSSPTVRSAMQGAVRVWRDNAIADGYGAMNPGAMVGRGGQLDFLSGQVPAFPNIQFWDYTKRIIDDKVAAAVRAGQGQKVRTLTRLAQQLRGELDNHVPSYREARAAWGGPSEYLQAIEDGRTILAKNVSAEELAANFANMTPAQREAYRVGAVSSIRGAMGNDGAKLGDMTKYLRSPNMREKIAAIMPTPEAAENWGRRLAYEVRSSEMTGKALGNSATARRLAQQEDEANIVGDLVMDALSHGATHGLMRRALLSLPMRVRDSLRSRSDSIMADILTQPQAPDQLRRTMRDIGRQDVPRPTVIPSATYTQPMLGQKRGGRILPPFARRSIRHAG